MSQQFEDIIYEVRGRAAWAHDWRNDRALSTDFLTLPTPA